MAKNKPDDAAPEAEPKHDLPRVGEVVPYDGDESNGKTAHPAIVTGHNEDGTFNATVFFDGSTPAPRKGLVWDEENDVFRVAPPKEG